MKKKAIIMNPLIWLVLILGCILSFVLLTASPSFQAFQEKFLLLVIALIAGAFLGVASNGFGLFGNKIFNIILLTFYGLFRWLFDAWGLADNPWVKWLYMPFTVTFVIGYALGTFFGKLAAG